MAAPLRSEIDNEFKWAVNDIYSSDNAWEEDYHKLIKLSRLIIFIMY